MLTRGERFFEARRMLPPNEQSMSRVEEATGVSKSLIQSLEDDDSQRDVGYTKIIALATHYGVSADWLLGLSDFRNIAEKQKLEGYHLLLRDLLELNTDVNDRERIVRILKSVITGFLHAVSCGSAYDLYERALLDVTSGLCSWMELAELISSDDFLPSDDEVDEIYELRFSLTNFILKAISIVDEKLWMCLNEVCPILGSVSSWNAMPLRNVEALIKNHATSTCDETEA